GIDAAQQLPAAALPAHAGVVAGGDALGAERAGVVQKGPELDFAIAEDVRVRRAAGAVLGDEMLEHAVPVFGGEVARVAADAQAAADRDGVLAVFLRATAAFAGVFLPVLHEQALDRHAGALQQQRRDRGIDAAGHADDDGAA